MPHKSDTNAAPGPTRRLLRSVARVGPDIVRCMSLFASLGARPEADIWPDPPADGRTDRLRAWTRAGDLTHEQAELLWTLDERTRWRARHW